MKILIVNISDLHGGAARAAYRLHQSLLAQNIESQMLVQNKISDDYTVVGEEGRFRKYFNIARSFLETIPLKQYKNRTQTFFSPSWFGFSSIADKINALNPDIVHLHWINDGMLRVEDLLKIEAPIVWSLHDMWPFTGGCHYDELCNAYANECGNCKVLGSTHVHDLSHKLYKRKEKIFSKIGNMTVVGLSAWLNTCSKSSTLLKDKRHIHLANPINTNIFKPIDQETARSLYGLPGQKKLVLFGAVGATSDPRKGFGALKSALDRLNNHEIELVIFGSSKPSESQGFGLKTHYVGSLKDDIGLVVLYNAVDVVVVPSLQENLSNVIMESLACRTPVVCFDIGGNVDMIEHKKTGYLAKPFDTTDLRDGIEWVLNVENYDELCQNARKKVLKEFDSVVIAKQYIELYQSILNG